MQLFTANKDVTVVVPMRTADDDTPLSVSAVSYRVLDETDTTVIDWTSLSTFVADADEAQILVPAANNQVASGAPRALRVLQLQLTVDGNVVPLEVAYVIQASDVLQVGVNSFQSLPAADFQADLLPNIGGWHGATSAQKTAALIEARLHICQLNFSPLNNNRLWGQDSLNFVPEGSFETPFAARGGSFIWGGNLAFLTAAQFNALPTRLLDDLRRAQIVEADAILGGDPVLAKRQSGIQLDSVGDAKVMFRSGKALQLPVCRRAASYLSVWITFQIRIGRC